MEDEADDGIAEAVCGIAIGAAPGYRRIRKWNEEVILMKGVVKIDEEAGL